MRDLNPTRRQFVQGTAAAVAAASLDFVPAVHAAGSDRLKIGLVGCGGRGTGAAEQALTADKNATLVAMADAFPDRLEECLSTLKGSTVEGLAARIDVPPDRRYSGFEAYKHVIDQVDVVLLATPPGFRPIHFAYAVEKGVHAFIEKPMAVDAPGLRMYLDAAKKSREKGLSAIHGFCWRYDHPRREVMKRLHDGAVGDVVAVEATYNSQGVWEPRRTREQCHSDMEYQMRNWYYYCWLSGDHIVEQAVHSIDTMSWAMGDKRPERCWGVGGRQARVQEKYGNIWDHFAIVYEYPGGARGYHQCRHWPQTPTQVKDYVLGSTGIVDIFGRRITGPKSWRYRDRGEKGNMYQNEHDELFAAIRSGQPLNNAEQAGYSTLLALMGRMAAYTGEFITWEQALNSQESLVPSSFSWGEAPQRPVPRPGLTKFV